MRGGIEKIKMVNDNTLLNNNENHNYNCFYNKAPFRFCKCKNVFIGLFKSRTTCRTINRCLTLAALVLPLHQFSESQ